MQNQTKREINFDTQLKTALLEQTAQYFNTRNLNGKIQVCMGLRSNCPFQSS